MLGYPWNQVFSSIEQSGPEHLNILAFQHSLASRKGEMAVEAADLNTISDFVDALNRGRGSQQWYIASYKKSSSSTTAIQASLLQR